MKDFYNTIGESGNQLAQSRIKAQTQQWIILNFYQKNPKEYFTPFDIQFLVLPKAPITSVRRAMTNLEQAGFLEMSRNAFLLGKHGKSNHGWRLNHENNN